MTDSITDLCKKDISAEDRLVVAVSGGADSMCLAHAMAKAASVVGAPLLIAHVNHQLRGEAAEEDARFVCAWAKERGLPRMLTRVTVQRKGGQSEENLARENRYKALVKACRLFKANKLVTAHNADDQVETFLLNLIRGSGGRGLRGMPESRFVADGVALIRPLLSVKREQIEAYCRGQGIPWRTDASNDSLSYRRNRIRLELLPHLRELNRGIDRVLLNTVGLLQIEQEFLDRLTAQALAGLKVPSPLPFAPTALEIEGLAALDLALQRRVVLSLLPKFAGSKHVDAILALASGKTGATVTLPGGRRVYRLHDVIAFGSVPPIENIVPILVTIPGEAVMGDLAIRAATAPLEGGEGFWLPATEDAFAVSARKAGDYFYPPGGGKKLKDYMIDKKIPRWLRDQFAVFRSGGEIFWIPGLCRDRRFCQPGSGKRFVCIKLHRIGGGLKDE